MEFTYHAYENMLTSLSKQGYIFSKFNDYEDKNKVVILRHDVDMSLNSAFALAELEYKNGIKSTYFVLVSTDFYNIFSKKSTEILGNILDMGHSIGLHFDEAKYNCKSINSIADCVCREKKILELCVNRKVDFVSMHRPSGLVLDNDIKFENIINTYSREFFSDFKYVSDSRMHWKENVKDLIEKCMYNKIHILTHPIWYNKKEEFPCVIIDSLYEKNREILELSLNENIKNFNDLIKKR